MFSRFRIALGLALLLLLTFAAHAFAGGWAVITLDELPVNVVAGEPLTIGFTVLQHGRTPMTNIDPTVTAKLSSAEKFVVHAEPAGKPGHYTATLTFPKGGQWEWSIQAFTMDQPLPVLQVAAPGSVRQPVAAAASEVVQLPGLIVVRGLAFGLALAGAILTLRRRSRMAGALTGLCLLIGLVTFITQATALKAEAQTQSELASKDSMAASISQAELGEQLFIAKGCITCHANNKVERASTYWTVEMGAPDLTNFTASPEVLRLRLKDPVLVKSDTKMPNLHLSDAEIEALIAFINSK